MVKKSKAKRIKNRSSTPKKQNVKGDKKPIESNSPLTFNLTYKNWLKGISIPRKEYTNKLKDKEMFTNYITELFYKIIPTIHQYGNDMIKEAGLKGWRHCHPVEEDKIDLVIDIMNEIHGDSFQFDKVAGPQLWQFGITQNIRIIAIHDYTNNILTPVFIDYHHLIHSNQHYNQDDYMKYKFCPIEKVPF